MPVSPLSVPQHTLAENIALLSCLGQSHMDPERNEIKLDDDGSSYRLSLEDEFYLTTTLAFLSGIKNDPNRITAVCIKEDPDKITALIAVNAKVRSESTYLNKVGDGFDSLFLILRRASCISHDTLLDDVLGHIVRMCHDRILDRARLRATESKPPLGRFLSALSAELAGLPKDGGISELDALAHDLAEKLRQYRANVPREPASEPTRAGRRDADIEEIVKAFYEISRVPDLKGIFERAFPKGPGVDQDMPKALLDKIRKIASYQKSALTLVRLARRYSIVRQASVKKVILDSDSFSWSIRAPNDVPTLLDVLRRLAKTGTGQWNAKSACQILQQRKGATASDFCQKLEMIEAGAKVHAEIQLVWYLDADDCKTPPRVIASNKEACYLCHTFITSQTHYLMPGTHGRLYPGWRLPTARASHLDCDKFTQELQRLAIRKVQETMHGQIAKNPGLVESLPPPTPMTCSVLSTVVEEDVDDAQSSGSETVVPEDGRWLAGSVSPLTSPLDAPLATPSNAPSSLAPASSCPPPVSPLDPPRASASSPPLASHSSPPRVSPSSPRSIVPGSVAFPPRTRSDHPSQVEQCTHQSLNNEARRLESEGKDEEAWDSVESGDTKRIRLDDSLVLYVEYTTARPRNDSTLLRIKTRRLSEEEASSIPSVDVCEAEDLQGELVCNPHRRALLRRGGHVFEIKWNGGDYEADGQT